MIRTTLLAAAAVLALTTGVAMAQSPSQAATQHHAATWANAHDSDYGYNHYPQ